VSLILSQQEQSDDVKDAIPQGEGGQRARAGTGDHRLQPYGAPAV